MRWLNWMEDSRIYDFLEIKAVWFNGFIYHINRHKIAETKILNQIRICKCTWKSRRSSFTRFIIWGGGGGTVIGAIFKFQNDSDTKATHFFYHKRGSLFKLCKIFNMKWNIQLFCIVVKILHARFALFLHFKIRTVLKKTQENLHHQKPVTKHHCNFWKDLDLYEEHLACTEQKCVFTLKCRIVFFLPFLVLRSQSAWSRFPSPSLPVYIRIPMLPFLTGHWKINEQVDICQCNYIAVSLNDSPIYMQIYLYWQT